MNELKTLRNPATNEWVAFLNSSTWWFYYFPMTSIIHDFVKKRKKRER